MHKKRILSPNIHTKGTTTKQATLKAQKQNKPHGRHKNKTNHTKAQKQNKPDISPQQYSPSNVFFEGTTLAEQCILTTMAEQCILTTMAEQCILTTMAEQCILTTMAEQCILTTMAEQCILTTMA